MSSFGSISNNRKKGSKGISNLEPELPPVKKQKLKPLTAVSATEQRFSRPRKIMIISYQLSKPPIFDLSGSQARLSQSSQVSPTAKAKAYLPNSNKKETRPDDGTLWADAYEPTTEVGQMIYSISINMTVIFRRS